MEAVQRVWHLPHRARGGLGQNDQVFSNLELLHCGETGSITAELIFVAGLGGHYIETWQAADGTVWLRDLLRLPEYGLDTTRVWSFHYNTTLRGVSKGDKMDDHARELLAHIMLKLFGKWTWAPGSQQSQTASHGTDDTALHLKPIIFIGHGLGGILIKKALIIAEAEKNYQLLWDAARGVMFFAVPHRLSRYDWGRYLRLVLKINAPIPGLKPTYTMESQASANCEALLGITEEFRRLQKYLAFVKYIEGRLMPGLEAPLIDEPCSWMDAPRKLELKLDGHYLNLCKFEKQDHRAQIIGQFDTVASHLKYLIGASKALEHIDDEARAALESLCPPGFHGSLMVKEATTGAFPRLRKAFQNRAGNDSESRLLWIQGPQNPEKASFVRHVITDLIPFSAQGKVAYCLLDDSVPGRRKLEHLLRTTLHHALRIEPELIRHYLVPHFRKAIDIGALDVADDDIWTLEVLVPLWPEAVAKVTSRGVLTVVVDSFSELPVDCQQGFLKCIDDFRLTKAVHRDCLKVLLVSGEGKRPTRSRRSWVLSSFKVVKVC